MADIICSTSLSNIKLAKTLNDLKNKESELIRNRNRFEGLFKNSPISIWEQDYSEVIKYLHLLKEGGVSDLREYFKQNKKSLLECTKLLKVVGVNNFTLKLFEASSEAELYSNFKRLIVPNSLDLFADSIINLYEGKRSFEGELELRTLKGNKLNVEYYIAATPGREEYLEYVIVNMLDITEKKETLNQLEAERKQLEVFFGTAVDLLCIADLEGKFVRLNKEWENVLGYSIEELVGAEIYSFIHPDDIESTIETTSKLREGEMVLNFVNRFICKDNSYRWIEWKSVSSNNLIYAAARDITNSYNFNNELQKSEARYRELFETMAQGVIYQNGEGIIINANPAAEKLLGIKLDFMLAEEIVDEWNKFIKLDGSIVPEEEHPAFMALHTGKPVTNKVLGIYNPEIMDWVWVMVNAVPQFRDGEDKPYQVFSTLDDITELKMAQDSLMASEERYSLAQRAAQIGSWDWDILTNEVSWSTEIEGMFGFEPGGFDGKFETYVNCVHPNDRSGMLNSIDQAMKGADYNVEVRIVWPNGEVHWINGTGDVIYNTDRVPIRMLGIVQDITSRKLVENEVKSNEEKFRRIFEDSPLGLVILTSEFSFLEVNSAFSKLLGYYSNELRTISLPSIIHPDDLNEILTGIKQLGERKIQQFRSELRYITRYGEIIWANLSVSILRNSDGTFRSFLAMISDITDRKKAEELLISAKNEAVEKSNALKDLNATKDKFFSIIAHDLKNPFFYLLASSQFVKEEFHNLDETEKYEIVSRFHDGTGKIYKLLENLLQWSRMKLDRIEFKVEEITLSSIIKEELEDSELGTENKNITITKKYDIDITFMADRNMFRTVIRNLISNAIKFSHKGGEIVVSAKSNPNLFSFSVQDFGVGIQQYNLEKLFKIDGEVSTKGTNDEEGTGLGLILCKEFIDKHNGTIKVESEPGKGSTFIVSFPQSN